MRLCVAFLLSVLVHAALAAALAVYVAYAPGPDTLAQLDLSSVDLSFAETEDETAAVSPSPASAPAEHAPEEPPPEPERPPEVEPPPKELPPEPEALKVPEPAPDAPPPLETPPPKREEPPEREEPPPKREAPPRPAAAASAPAPAAAPRQARVDAPPRPRRNIKPDYPKGARQRGEQGDVNLEIEVTASGAVDGVRVVSSSGYPELDEAAVKAVKAARFTPARRGSRPVASTARITLTFLLK